MQNGQQEMVASGGSLHAKCCGGLLGTKLICWKPRVLRLYMGGRNTDNTGGVATREQSKRQTFPPPQQRFDAALLSPRTSSALHFIMAARMAERSSGLGVDRFQIFVHFGEEGPLLRSVFRYFISQEVYFAHH